VVNLLDRDESSRFTTPLAPRMRESVGVAHVAPASAITALRGVAAVLAVRCLVLPSMRGAARDASRKQRTTPWVTAWMQGAEWHLRPRFRAEGAADHLAHDCRSVCDLTSVSSPLPLLVERL